VRDLIIRKLEEIEREENVRILHAVESGSRAWGFASPDSDYDVRFLYMRDTDHYLRLDRPRDVLEYPVSGELDLSGWDLDKTLKLLHASNPTLFEWANSTVVYRTTETYADLKPLINRYFVAKSGMWHYLSMADGNYRAYLKGGMVRAKKYFYVIRPLLACRWVFERRTPPPMLFSELVESQLEEELKPAVNDLLAVKMSAREIGEIPRIEPLNDWIERSLTELREKAQAMPGGTGKDWAPLNRVFLEILKKTGPGA